MKKIICLIFLLFFFSSVYSLTFELDLNQNSGNTPIDVNLTAVITDGVSPFVFEWDFEGDGVIDATTNTPNNSMIYTYGLGYHTAKVKVTDLINEQAEQTKDINVANVNGNFPPIININGPYVVAPSQSFTLNPTGSFDLDGSIRQYRWRITSLTGDPDCPNYNIIVNTGLTPPGLPEGATVISCNGTGTAEVNLEIRDDGSPWESATATTMITIREVQTSDLINIVKMNLEPEMIKENQNLEVKITVRNATNRIINFDLNFEVKLNQADTNISALPNLIENLALINQELEAYSQKDFIITITSAELSALKTQENYWVYATATAYNPETNKTFNSRRAIFSYNEIKTLQLPETNLIGIILVLAVSMILIKR